MPKSPNRFFVNHPLHSQKTVQLPSDITHRVTRVMRLKVSASFVLFNGDGWDYCVTLLNVKTGEVRLESRERPPSLLQKDRNIILCPSVLKDRAMQEVIEKTVELGVQNIQPIWSQNCQLSKKTFDEKKVQQWRLKSTVALEQCGRADAVRIETPIEYEALLKNECRYVVLDPRASCDFSSLLINGGHKIHSGKMGILVGPEGGWSNQEVVFFNYHKFTRVKLNTPILRAETASVVAFSLLSLV